ncbi:MAG: hypothetical protein GY797_26435 [Deltaproteobacteria bacterium]|nr:hypothetical protein [Deltaproteobacteria bacterium]
MDYLDAMLIKKYVDTLSTLGDQMIFIADAAQTAYHINQIRSTKSIDNKTKEKIIFDIICDFNKRHNMSFPLNNIRIE